MYLQSDISFYVFHIVCGLHYDTAARMVEEHAQSKMIQRALMGELEPKDDRALQKIGRKKQAKNTALIYLFIYVYLKSDILF